MAFKPLPNVVSLKDDVSSKLVLDWLFEVYKFINTLATVTTVGNLTSGTAGIITITNGTNAVNTVAGTAIAITQATSLLSGYLSSTDWNTFNNKQSTITWGDGLELSGTTAAIDYNTTNLKITATELNTIQNIATSSSPTFTGLNLSGLTASEIVATDGSNALQSLAVATYPSLTELSYVKGVTSALQTQIDGKINTNYIINGNFDFWQRGTSLSAGAGGVLADRCNGLASGSTIAQSQQTFTLGQTDVPGNPKYYYRAVVASSAGANNYAIIGIYPGDKVADLSGETVILSFYAKADASKNIALTLAQNFGAGGSPSSVVNTAISKVALTSSWQKITQTFVIPSISGKTLGTDGKDHQRIYFWFDAGSTYDTLTGTLGQQSGTFDIAQIKLEKGSIATPFVLAGGTLAGELVACQRYYEKSYYLDYIPGTSTATDAVIFTGYGTTDLYGNIAYKASKRYVPVVTIYNFQGTTGDVTKVSDALALGSTGMALGWAGLNGFTRLSKTGGTNVTAGAQYFFHWTADAEL